VLTSLRIKNFKAWRDTGELRLAPLTVLFGSNSSGKSSLHQLLLMLRQTAESSDRRRVLHFGDKNTPVDLGSFQDAVRGHDARLHLGFTLGWRLPEKLRFEDVKSGMQYGGTNMRFEADVGAVGAAPPRLVVSSFTYELSGDGTSMSIGLQRDSKGKYRVTADAYQPVFAVGRKWPVSSPSHFYGFPDDANARYQNLEFVADLVLQLEEALGSIVYLGPLREPPERLYRWSGEQPDDVGWKGERSVDALLAGSDLRFNRKPKQPYTPLQYVVAQWLERLGVIDTFNVVAIGKGRDEYEIRVRAPGRQAEVLLTDVGFGVSQVLPVIVQCFYAARNSTLIFEQPEIHLHPGVQAGLADLFLDALTIREHGAPRRPQIIVESHSEHFLRRLLRHVAEETIAPDDIALYVATSGRHGSTIEPLEVDDLGAIRNWPPDFFGDQMNDIAAQAEAALKRRLSADA